MTNPLKLTPKEINDLKRRHNALQEEGRPLLARLEEMRDECYEIQAKLSDAEGDDYDPIPLMFGAGFWIDEDIK